MKGLDQDVVRQSRQFSIAFNTLFRKECHRFLSVFNQTVTTPVISSSLYLFIFGWTLGGKLTIYEGVSYLQFLVPGLMMMSLINNSYQNTISSLMIGKYSSSLTDILCAPITYTEFVTAYILAAIVRGALVGTVVLVVSLCFTPMPFASIPVILASALLSAIIFGGIGMIAGIWARSFDQSSMITSFILTPLVYLGGVFYSVNSLPSFWRVLSKANPLLYMIDSMRYGFLGVSDINPAISLSFLAFVAVSVFAVCLYILKTGWRLRT